MKYDLRMMANLFIIAGIPGMLAGFAAAHSKALQAVLFVSALVSAVAQFFYKDVFILAWLLVFSIVAFFHSKLFERFMK